MVEQVNDTEALRDTDLNRVRSVEGVAWAAPFYQGMVRTRMRDGSFKFVQLIGIDATTFAGAPKEITQGRLDDLRVPNTVILDEYGAQKLSRDSAKPIGVGEIFEINDHEARVVGICKTRMAFSGDPYVFTTYDQAVQYAPGTRKMLSCVLAGAKPGDDPAAAARRITAATGLKERVGIEQHALPAGCGWSATQPRSESERARVSCGVADAEANRPPEPWPRFWRHRMQRAAVR